MNNDEFKKIRIRANNLINDSKLKALKDEKSLIEQIYEITSDDNKSLDYNLINKTLKCIDIYIEIKSKMLLAKEDFDYLNILSNELKNQRVRTKDGILHIPLFKIVRNNSEERYFLTRNSAREFIALHKNWYKDNIIIEETNNLNLLRIIEIIKRNY